MSRQPTVSSEQRRVLALLRELIAALDKRVPQLQRDGESQIALDAARLKEHARARITAIENSIAPLHESGIPCLPDSIVR